MGNAPDFEADPRKIIVGVVKETYEKACLGIIGRIASSLEEDEETGHLSMASIGRDEDESVIISSNCTDVDENMRTRTIRVERDVSGKVSNIKDSDFSSNSSGDHSRANTYAYPPTEGAKPLFLAGAVLTLMGVKFRQLKGNSIGWR